MKVALIGSVSSSWFALDALIRGGVEITAVLGVDESQADKISDYRPLRSLATDSGIPFRSFVKVSEPAVEEFLRAHVPDMIWVIGLSQLVPESLIKIAPHGSVGFHPTMLPEGRGRAPVAWTILKGARAAVNLFFLTDEPDAGDIIVQREVLVLPVDYSEDLIHRTNLVLRDVILELAPLIKSGKIPRTAQDHSKATYYPKRTPSNGLIDWSASTDAIYRLLRASGRPYPGAFTWCKGRKLIVWRGKPAEPEKVSHNAQPGRILAIDKDGNILVATGDGGVWMTEVQLEGIDEPQRLLRIGTQLGSLNQRSKK
jgi:methionyl-tRNA formyltransferase